MTKVAIIDLGSNTFHLLIASIEDEHFKSIYSERQYVFLSEAGVNEISSAAYSRGIACLNQFVQKIKQHEVSDIKVIGTATLRKASNGAQFVAQVKEQLNLSIEIISGDKEASLIAKGVLMSITDRNKGLLIMDIGGGSVEFIIVISGEVKWQKSYPIGLSIIYHAYQKSDPMTIGDINKFFSFLKDELTELNQEIERLKPTVLVGASGSFEVARDMATNVKSDKSNVVYTVPKDALIKLAKSLYSLGLDKRLRLEALPKSRAKYIAIAMLLIEYVVNSYTFDEIMISEYAIKEGLLAEYII